MLSDRSYMRDSDPTRELRPLVWLIGGLVAAFALQFFVDRAAPGTPDRWFALSANNILEGRIWVLATYSLLHDTGSPLHLIFNALGILFIGRLLLPAVGRSRFLLTYAGGVLAGGILWLAVHITGSGHLIGASGGVYALFALFCCQFAHERMTFLLFFVLPVTVQPRYLLTIAASITAIFFLFAEMFGNPSGIAHSAHLAGMIAGVIAFRAFREPPEDPRETARPAVELPAWLRKKSAAPSPKPKFTVNIANRSDLKAEVDRILDKINTSGFGSLTAEEKRTLDDARDLLSKR